MHYVWEWDENEIKEDINIQESKNFQWNKKVVEKMNEINVKSDSARKKRWKRGEERNGTETVEIIFEEVDFFLKKNFTMEKCTHIADISPVDVVVFSCCCCLFFILWLLHARMPTQRQKRCQRRAASSLWWYTMKEWMQNKKSRK